MTYYQTLGVAPSSKYEEIRRAYRGLAAQHHPDKGGDPLMFRAIQEAFEIIGDDAKRRAYDAGIKNKPVQSLSETATLIVDEYLAGC